MVYSFDVFDTLITRTTAEPKGIFTIMEEILRKDALYERYPLHLRRHFRQFRVEAEVQARYRAGRAGEEDVTLELIYAQLSHMNYISQEQEAELMQLELHTELENCVPIQDNIMRLKELKGQHDVYLISDMYLPSEHIRKMLLVQDAVFSDIPILVSGELGKTKGRGSLYTYFIEKYHIDRNAWVHIGDNFSSDYLAAQRFGARSELYRGYGFSEFEKSLLERGRSDCPVQMALGTIKNEWKKADTTEKRIGIRIGGPVLYGYVLWVLQEALRQGIHTLFFMARDGYLLKKIADIIIEQQKLELGTCYLYGSRYAWRVSAVSANESDFAAWVESYSSFYTFSDLAEELHLPQEELAVFFPKVLQKSGKLLSEKEKRMIKDIMRSDKELFRKISERHEKSREQAAAYLRQEIAAAEGRIAFVEVNGSGGTQCCMRQLMDDFYKEQAITFYYSIAWFVDFPSPNNIFYKYMYEKLPIDDVVELLTRAPHGQTRGYRQKEDGRWEPVLDDVSVESPEEWEYGAYIDGVLLYTKEMCARCQCNGEDLAGLSLDVLKHICTEPEEDVQHFIGDMSFSLEGTKKSSDVYAPRLTEEQLRQLYLFCKPKEECYSGLKLEFSLLRRTPEQRKRVEHYKSMNPGRQVERKKSLCEYSQEVSGDIILYGAGKRGQTVFRELQENQNARVVLWVDKNYANCARMEREISAPGKIPETKYDYVLIGVKDEGMIREIRGELARIGVPMAKILW